MNEENKMSGLDWAWFLIKIIYWYPFKILYVGARWVYRKVTGTVSDIRSDVKNLNKREKEAVIHILDNQGLKETLPDGSDLLPSFAKDKEGNVLLGILNTQKIEDFEGVLRGFGEVFSKDYLGFTHVKNNVYKLQVDAMPSEVIVDDMPEIRERCFWLGVNEKGEDVVVDTEHSAGMMISGAARSGKSVTIKAIVQSFLHSTPNTQVTILDPKRVSFTKIFKGWDKVNIVRDLEDAAAYIRSLKEEMESRYKWMENHEVEKITEANELGAGWDYQLYVIDEAQSWLEQCKKTEVGEEVFKLRVQMITDCSDLMRLGAACGFFGVYASQGASADIYPKDVRTNALVKMSFAMPSDSLGQAYFGNGVPYKMADKSLIRGKGVLVDPINGFNKLQVVNLS